MVGLLHLIPAHWHGVDCIAEFVEGEGFGGAELFAAVLADQDGGEVGGSDVEAAAGFGGVGGGEAGLGGGGGVVGDGDDEDVALVEAGGGVFEPVIWARREGSSGLRAKSRRGR